MIRYVASPHIILTSADPSQISRISMLLFFLTWGHVMAGPPWSQRHGTPLRCSLVNIVCTYRIQYFWLWLWLILDVNVGKSSLFNNSSNNLLLVHLSVVTIAFFWRGCVSTNPARCTLHCNPFILSPTSDVRSSKQHQQCQPCLNGSSSARHC